MMTYQHRYLYANSVSQTKVFRTVNRYGLRIIFRKFGCPLKVTSIIKLFHEMMGWMISGYCPSIDFTISNGVKQ